MSYDNKIYDPTKSADLELSIHKKEKYYVMAIIEFIYTDYFFFLKVIIRFVYLEIKIKFIIEVGKT